MTQKERMSIITEEVLERVIDRWDRESKLGGEEEAVATMAYLLLRRIQLPPTIVIETL